MEISLKSNVLATGQIHGERFSDEAMRQLREQLIGANVFMGYAGPFIGPIVCLSAEAIEQIKTEAATDRIPVGHVRSVQGDEIIAVVSEANIQTELCGETTVAKLDLLVNIAKLKDGSIEIGDVVEILGVYLSGDRVDQSA